MHSSRWRERERSNKGKGKTKVWRKGKCIVLIRKKKTSEEVSQVGE